MNKSNYLGKQLPSNIEAEKALLCSILHRDPVFDEVKDILVPKDFFDDRHKEIFTAMIKARESDLKIDNIIIIDELNKLGNITTQFSYLIELEEGIPSAEHAISHAKKIKEASQLREIIKISETSLADCYKEDKKPTEILSQLSSNLQPFAESVTDFNLKTGILAKHHVLSINEMVKKHDETRFKYNGKNYIGFPQKTIPELDEALLGLRELMVLPAASNTGKTALSTQLGVDVIRHNENIGLLIVSLEMRAEAIISRLRSYLSKITWRKLHLDTLTPEEMKRLHIADQTLNQLNSKMRILDSENCPNINLNLLLSHVEDLKQKNQLQHVMVIIDYLQVWPTPPNHNFLAVKTELELDKWRIGEMKKLRDILKNDPVLVISEIRKTNEPPKGTDLMGSVRTYYTSDVVLLYWPLNDEDIYKEIEGYLGDDVKAVIGEDKDKIKAAVKRYHEKENLCVNLLCVDKGRDGMKKTKIPLRFYYYENRFESFTWQAEALRFKNHCLSLTSDTKNEIRQDLKRVARAHESKLGS